MDSILQTLSQPSAVSVEDLRSMVHAITENSGMVKEYVPEEGGNFLHTLSRLPCDRQAEVLPLFYLAVIKGVDIHAQDDKVSHPMLLTFMD